MEKVVKSDHTELEGPPRIWSEFEEEQPESLWHRTRSGFVCNWTLGLTLASFPEVESALQLWNVCRDSIINLGGLANLSAMIVHCALFTDFFASEAKFTS